LWGQSNCTGEDDYANSTNSNGYVNNYTPVTMTQWITAGVSDPIAWVKQGTTAALAPRAAAGTPNFGAELSLGRHLNRVLPNSWVISKWGMTSSDLAVNWLPTGTYPTSPAGSPNLFTQAMHDAAAVAAANNATVSALVWIQGESDALDATKAANYQTNLLALIAAVRAVYPNLPVVISRIPASSPEANNTAVYNAQTTVAGSTPHCALVNTDDLTPLITTYHFSANNLVTLGNRLASSLLGLLGIPDVFPSLAWTTDGDGIGFPQNATEWAAVMAAAGITSGGPFRASDCTVVSGNLPDLIGSVPLVASGTGVTYRATVPGFTRVGLSTPDLAAASFATADASLPNIATTSMLTLTYVRVNSSPGSWRNLTSLGAAASPRVKSSVKAGGVVDYFDGNTNHTAGVAVLTGAVRPIVTQRNVTAQVSRFASDQETVTATWDPTVTGKGLSIVGDTSKAPNGVTMYEASFAGAAAELSLTQIKSLLTTLGWVLQY
jgi:hypothetical protein